MQKLLMCFPVSNCKGFGAKADPHPPGPCPAKGLDWNPQASNHPPAPPRREPGGGGGLPGTQWQQAQWPLGSLCPRLSSGGALRLQCGDSLSLHPCHALLGPPAGGGAGEKTALEEGKKKAYQRNILLGGCVLCCSAPQNFNYYVEAEWLQVVIARPD